MDFCAFLLSWVLHLTSYGPVEGCPELVRVSHPWLEAQACDGEPCKVLGWYPGTGDRIYLDRTMDIEGDLVHTSIALHEMVHWVQGVQGKLAGDCASSLWAEREAYRIQRQFLEQYGSPYPVGRAIPRADCDQMGR